MRSAIYLIFRAAYGSLYAKSLILICTISMIIDAKVGVQSIMMFVAMISKISLNRIAEAQATMMPVLGITLLHYCLLTLISYLKRVIYSFFLTDSSVQTLYETLYLDYGRFYLDKSEDKNSLVTASSKGIAKLAKIYLVTIPDFTLSILAILFQFYIHLDPKEFALFILYMSVSSFLCFLSFIVINRYDDISKRSFLMLPTIFSNIMGNYDIVKSFCAEQKEITNFNLGHKIFQKDYKRVIRHNFYLTSLQRCAFRAPHMMVLYLFIRNSYFDNYSKDFILQFSLLYIKLENNLYSLLSYIYDAISSYNLSKPRLLLNQCPEETVNKEGKDLNDSIELKGVSLFAGQAVIQKSLFLKFNKGDKIAITGTNGSGKSTLLKTLMKFSRYSGTITFDGISLDLIDNHALRSMIAYVPQTPFIINETILYNLGYSQEIYDEAWVYSQCKLYGFHELFLSLPNGYFTITGENGGNLSGGQNQIISFMRAVIKNSPIFILDEPTANMETNAEKKMIDKLLENSDSKTIFAILHNDCLLKSFDKILVLENEKTTIYHSYNQYNIENKHDL